MDDDLEDVQEEEEGLSSDDEMVDEPELSPQGTGIRGQIRAARRATFGRAKYAALAAASQAAKQPEPAAAATRSAIAATATASSSNTSTAPSANASSAPAAEQPANQAAAASNSAAAPAPAASASPDEKRPRTAPETEDATTLTGEAAELAMFKRMNTAFMDTLENELKKAIKDIPETFLTQSASELSDRNPWDRETDKESSQNEFNLLDRVEEVNPNEIPEQLDGFGLLRAPSAKPPAVSPAPRPVAPSPEREQAKARQLRQAEHDDAVIRQEDEKLNRILQKHLIEGLFSPAEFAELNADGLVAFTKKCLQLNTLVPKRVTRQLSTPEMDLLNYGLGDLGTIALSEALKLNKTMRVLNLEGNSVSEKSCGVIADVLCSENSTLRTLILNRNPIGEQSPPAIESKLLAGYSGMIGALALAKVIRVHPNLSDLRIAHNEVSDVVVESLAEGLLKNTALRRLDLTGNKVTARGATALVDCLPDNASLTQLDLADNSLRDKGGELLAAAIANNTRLLRLDVAGNGFTDAIGPAWTKALASNSALNHLSLARNRFTGGSINGIAAVLEKNSTLQTLALTGNQIRSDEVGKLKELLQKARGLQMIEFDGLGDVVQVFDDKKAAADAVKRAREQSAAEEAKRAIEQAKEKKKIEAKIRSAYYGLRKQSRKDPVAKAALQAVPKPEVEEDSDDDKHLKPGTESPVDLLSPSGDVHGRDVDKEALMVAHTLHRAIKESKRPAKRKSGFQHVTSRLYQQSSPPADKRPLSPQSPKAQTATASASAVGGGSNAASSSSLLPAITVTPPAGSAASSAMPSPRDSPTPGGAVVATTSAAVGTALPAISGNGAPASAGKPRKAGRSPKRRKSPGRKKRSAA